MHRRQFLANSLIAGISTTALRPECAFVDATDALDYRIKLESPAKLFDGKESFCHPRAGVVPAAGKDGMPRVVVTMTTIDLSGSDVYKAMYGLTTDDLGKTWTEAERVPELSFRMETIAGAERPVSCADFWPAWHKTSQTLLGTGHTVVYTPEWKVVPDRPRHTCYATFNANTLTWNPWKKLTMPEGPKFSHAGAGCTQRYDLPDGTVLLPVYFNSPGRVARTTIVRSSFNGEELQYLDHGQELEIKETDSRGLGEPSLTKFGGRFYLTMRNDKRGYATRGNDGQSFESIRPWAFDDAEELGNYNTQQHWVTHSDGLFLVYNRRGLNNDHVFRHRAPLMMAQVDPDKLCVIRDTERELVPNRGARLGNFGVTNVSPDETWVTVAEWMQPKGVEKYGSDGSVWVARIHWNRPNRLF